MWRVVCDAAEIERAVARKMAAAVAAGKMIVGLHVAAEIGKAAAKKVPVGLRVVVAAAAAAKRATVG